MRNLPSVKSSTPLATGLLNIDSSARSAEWHSAVRPYLRERRRNRVSWGGEAVGFGRWVLVPKRELRSSKCFSSPLIFGELFRLVGTEMIRWGFFFPKYMAQRGC